MVMEFDEKNMLKDWLTGIRILTIGHYKAAKKFEEHHRYLGMPVIILSAVVGTAIFASIEGNPHWLVQGFVGLLSLSAAILSSLQTFLGYAQLAEKHKAAAVRYSQLRRELDAFCSYPPPREEHKAFIADFRMRWDMLEEEAPTIPHKVYKAVVEEQATATVVQLRNTG
jgi:hypothetical protein